MSRSGPRRSGGGGGAPLPALQDEDVQSPAGSGAQRNSGGGAAGGVFKSAAVEVLRRTRRLMTTGEICRLALDWGLLSCSGRTPEASMASALYGDVKRREQASPFIRPQEGLFGLREWADPGCLPASWHHPPLPHHPQWQPHVGAGYAYSGPAPGGYQAPVLEVAQAAPVAAPGALAGLGASLSAGAGSVAGSAAPPSGLAAAPAPQAAPSSARSGGASTAVPPPAHKGRALRKRARRAATDEGDEEWSCGSGSHSDSEQRGGSDADERLEPRSYALRKGQVGRLREAAAAAATGSAPSRRASSQEQAAADDAPPLGQLELPRLRPPSAEGSQLGSQRAGSAGGGAGGLPSPPLYAALHSPHAHPPAAGSGAAASRPSFLSPATVPPYHLSSPLAPLPSLATPAGLAGLLSPLGAAAQQAQEAQQAQQAQQEPCASALPAQPAAVAALKASAAGCASLAPSAPGTALSAMMVPVCEAAAAAGAAAAAAAHQAELPPILPLDPLQQPQLWVSAAAAAATAAGAGAGAGAAPPPGPAPQVIFRPLQGGREGELMQIHVYASGQLPALTSEALSSGSFDIVPSGAAGELGGPSTTAAAAGALLAPGLHAVGGGGGGAAAAAIARKIAEVEGKVEAVEARWGPLSLKTGRAHFLLHHACRHPAAAAAAAFRDKGAAALQRAQEILQHHRQLGLGGSEAEEFAALLQVACGAGPAR